MQQTHAIIWVARDRDKSGIGTKRFSKDEAEQLAAELNAEHPAFAHRAVEAAAAEAAIAELRASLSTVTAPQNVTYPDFVAERAATMDVPTLAAVLPLPRDPNLLPASGE